MSDWQVMPLAEKSYQPRSRSVSRERLVNLYPEANARGARYPVTLYGTPGLKPWADVGDGPVRGIYRFGSDIYIASGERLYVVDVATRAATSLGPIGGIGAVRMIDNGQHVAVATSDVAWAANRSGLIALPESHMSSVAYFDGYVILAQRGTDKFYISGVDDLTTIAPLDFSTADAFADNVVGCINRNRELWLLGAESIEIWGNSGDPSFPFARSGGGTIEHGCAAVGSIAKTKKALFWVDDQLQICMAVGYQPDVISTPDIDRIIAATGSVSSAEAFTYNQDGHEYYVLTVGDRTFAYGIDSGRWHERSTVGLDRWRAAGHVFSSDKKHLVGACDAGKVFELDLDTYTDDSEPLVREVVAPPIDSGALPAIHDEVFLRIEPGVGLGSGQGSDPVAMLDWASDDGRTFGNEVTATIGKAGEYRNRATWTRLGQSTKRDYRFRFSDPVRVAILGAEARLSMGA